MNVNTIALWVSILAGGAGIYGVHLQSTQQTADATKAAINRQHAMDALYARLGNDEATIAAVAAQMPEDKRQILIAIQTAQKTAQEQPQVMFEKSMRIPDVAKNAAADAPAVEKGPQ